MGLAARTGPAICAAVAVIALSAVAAVGVSVWPIFTLAAAAVFVVIVLARAEPAWALVLAVAIFGTEGWLKGLLVSTGAPSTGHEEALGAALLDLALAAAIVGILVAERNSIAVVWRQLDRLAHLGIVLLGAWIGLSLLQVFQSGSLNHGLDGFRLTQAYVGVAVAAALLLYTRLELPRLVTLLLACFGVITTYAALRLLVGPTNTERWFALTRNGTTEYGGVFRAVGSFSSAVGLASYVVPAGVFAYGVAIFSRRHRALAAFVFATATAATVGSYSRAGIVGLAVGLLLVTAIAFRAEFKRPRQRRIAMTAILAVFVVGVGATVLASRVSPVTEQRLSGITNPAGDASMQLRFGTWKRTGRQILHQPLGSGVGTVGRATGLSGAAQVTTDNSFLKITREQGVEGILIFVAGLTTLLVAIARKIRTLSPERRMLAAAALGGVVGFLVMCVFGEFIEQPGKVVAWMLLGLAVASLATMPSTYPSPTGNASTPTRMDDGIDARDGRRRPSLAWLGAPVWLRATWLVALLVLVVGSCALVSSRTSGYTASVAAYSGPRLRSLAARRTSYFRRLLADPIVGQQATSGIPFPFQPAEIPGRVSLRPTTLATSVSAKAASPLLASDLVNGVGIALANAGAREAVAHPHGKLTRVVIGPRAVPPQPRGRVDRMLSRLPGVLPPRPALWTTVLVGIAVTLLIVLVTALRYRPSRRVSEADASMPVTTSQKLAVP